VTLEYLHLRLHPAEYYHFRFATQSIQTKIYEYDFACSLLWVWSFVSNIKKHKLRVFDNSVLRETFGSKGDEITRQ